MWVFATSISDLPGPPGTPLWLLYLCSWFVAGAHQIWETDSLAIELPFGLFGRRAPGALLLSSPGPGRKDEMPRHLPREISSEVISVALADGVCWDKNGADE